MLNRRPTIQDVAKQAGVSTATVSRAISSPTRVSAKTQKLVSDAVAETGYVLNEAARNLRTQKARTICIISPDLSNPFFSVIISGIEQVAAENGYGVFVSQSGSMREASAGSGVSYGNLISSARVDGFIVLDGTLNESMFLQSAGCARQTPTVLACEWQDSDHLPTVAVDNLGGARLAIRHLADLGHRQIGHLLGPEGNVLSELRYQGYRQELESQGLSFNEAFVYSGGFSLDSGIEAAKLWLSSDQRPTAVFCCSDLQALGFMSHVARQGVKVPDQVSVVGFDDLELAAIFVPCLTTVRQPRELIGRNAAIKLFAQLNQAADNDELPLHECLPVELVERSSSGPAPTL